jgi:PilZ domain
MRGAPAVTSTEISNQASESDDRRSEARLSPGDVTCHIDDIQVVHVLGLSLSGHGMRVMTNKRLPAQQPFAIGLQLDEQTTLPLQGRVVWERDEDLEFTHRYISGIQFIDTATPHDELLRSFIEGFVAREESQAPVDAAPPTA